MSDQSKKSKSKALRNPDGTFVKGQSGNPGGRPRGLMRWAREQAEVILKEKGPDGDAFRIMGNILHGQYMATPSDRIAAFRHLADRALGKPLSYVEITGADEEPLAGPTIDVTKLTDAELIQFLALAEKAAASK